MFKTDTILTTIVVVALGAYLYFNVYQVLSGGFSSVAGTVAAATK